MSSQRILEIDHYIINVLQNTYRRTLYYTSQCIEGTRKAQTPVAPFYDYTWELAHGRSLYVQCNKTKLRTVYDEIAQNLVLVSFRCIANVGLRVCTN